MGRPYLTESLLVTASANFEVSLSENTGFGNSVTVLQTGGRLTSTPVYIRFLPSSTGIYNGNLQISSANAAAITIPLAGNADAYPQMNVEGNTISIVNGDNTPLPEDATDFGDISIGEEPVYQTFTIKNTGSAPINFAGSGNVMIEGPDAADFSVTLQPGSAVPVSASRIFTVAFNPSSKGIKTASISIANNDPARSPFHFSIQGTGTGPDIAVLSESILIAYNDLIPSPIDGTFLGSELVNVETLTGSFTIKNQSLRSVSLTGDPRIIISGANAGDFAVTTNPSSPLSAAQSVVFEIILPLPVRDCGRPRSALRTMEKKEIPIPLLLRP